MIRIAADINLSGFGSDTDKLMTRENGSNDATEESHAVFLISAL
jgi:hypothetical protein